MRPVSLRNRIDRPRTLVSRKGLLALALMAASAVATGGGDGPPNASAQAGGARELGRGQVGEAPASCPRNCEAVGKVTGYQLLSGGSRNAYRVPANGRIIAWSIKASKPNASQMAFFNDFYGGAPQARLSVLQSGGGSVLRLIRQSPVQPLQAALGERTRFVLDSPLSVRRGQIIGLTTNTWVPAFATRLGPGDAWRASRPSNRCSNIKRSSSHTATNTRRTYGCVYRTARLLYTAWFIPNR